jgi:hypothetical protein
MLSSQPTWKQPVLGDRRRRAPLSGVQYGIAPSVVTFVSSACRRRSSAIEHHRILDVFGNSSAMALSGPDPGTARQDFEPGFASLRHFALDSLSDLIGIRLQEAKSRKLS